MHTRRLLFSFTPALAWLVACEGSPPPASCPPPPEPDPELQCLVPAPEVELTFSRRGPILTLEGSGYVGLHDTLLTDEGTRDAASCGITVIQSSVKTRPDLRAPAAWKGSVLPLVVAHEIVCRAQNADVVVTVSEIKAHVRSHRDVRFRSKWVIDGESQTLRPELPVDVVVTLEDAPLSPGHGRLRVVGGVTTPVIFTRVTSTGEDAPRLEVGPGETPSLPAGIYRTTEGDHFGIREGRTTYLRPGNPRALVFDGRRFPLDDLVPPLGVAGDFSYESPANIRRCKEVDKSGCFGERPLRDQAAVDSDDGFLEKLAVVDQVVFYIDGTADTPAGVRAGLGRSLSFHTDIDFDGGLVQGLDLVREAYAGPRGPHSHRQVHVRLNNLMKNLVREPDAPAYPAEHPRMAEMKRHSRPKSDEMEINGGKMRAHGFTEAQWRTLGSVVRGLVQMLPGLAPEAVGGVGPGARYQLLEPPELGKPGLFGHYHTSEVRWDPGPGFDWERLMSLLDAPPVAL